MLPMLHGQLITLRPVRTTDLDRLYSAHTDIANRGAFFNQGRNQDLVFYSMLSTDPRPWS